MEFGIFNDDGCIEAGFATATEAEEAVELNYRGEDVEVLEMCPDHDGQPYDHCAECATEED